MRAMAASNRPGTGTGIRDAAEGPPRVNNSVFSQLSVKSGHKKRDAPVGKELTASQGHHPATAFIASGGASVRDSAIGGTAATLALKKASLPTPLPGGLSGVASPMRESLTGGASPCSPQSARSGFASIGGSVVGSTSSNASPSSRMPNSARGSRGVRSSGMDVPSSTEVKEKKKPPPIVSTALEFKPTSRSSSEAGSPQVSPKNDITRQPSITSSIGSGRQSMTTTYVNFDKFDLQIENGRAPQRIMSWDGLLGLCSPPDTPSGQDDSEMDWQLRQALEWYEWPSPTKFQAVAVPCIVQACSNVSGAKNYTLLQAASGLGKTSSIVLSALVSLKRDVQRPQFIILAIDAIDDIERYVNALGCLLSVKVAYFREQNVEEVSKEDCVAAEGAQIIVGHPNHVCKVLQAAQQQVSLTSIQALLIDDAAALIVGGWVNRVCEINQLISLFAQNPLRYVVVSMFLEREAKPALRALKSSLMSKKNMFDLSEQVGRIRKHVKHYTLKGNQEGWLNTLLKLRDMVYIPRAVLFCDNEAHFQSMKQAVSGGIRGGDGQLLSVAINDPKEQSATDRAEQIRQFAREKYDFLLTRSEPNIFQASMPRVFWIVHFGVDEKNLPWYGCRLLCLDSTLREKAAKSVHHDGVSILFLPSKQKESVPKLEKLFGIKFEALPFTDPGMK